MSSRWQSIGQQVSKWQTDFYPSENICTLALSFPPEFDRSTCHILVPTAVILRLVFQRPYSWGVSLAIYRANNINKGFVTVKGNDPPSTVFLVNIAHWMTPSVYLSVTKEEVLRQNLCLLSPLFLVYLLRSLFLSAGTGAPSRESLLLGTEQSNAWDLWVICGYKSKKNLVNAVSLFLSRFDVFTRNCGRPSLPSLKSPYLQNVRHWHDRRVA